MLTGCPPCPLFQPSLAPSSGPPQLVNLRGGNRAWGKRLLSKPLGLISGLTYLIIWKDKPVQGVKRGRTMKGEEKERGNRKRRCKEERSSTVLASSSGFHPPSQFVGSGRHRTSQETELPAVHRKPLAGLRWQSQAPDTTPSLHVSLPGPLGRGGRMLVSGLAG